MLIPLFIINSKFEIIAVIIIYFKNRKSPDPAMILRSKKYQCDEIFDRN